ncbi:MAG: endonuclease/exonuclease/phosphatase family protein [Maritimibacter sp.]|nr:endonuclease/exonuclease/phosphatase family protein [Maritimibacter sp.]
MRRLVLLVAGLAALLVLAGFAGAVSRAADTLALARPALAPLALLGAFAARPAPWRAAYAAIGLGALATMGLALNVPPVEGDIRIYQKNLWAGNRDTTPLAADIEAADVDAAFFQEVSDRNDTILDQLEAGFPHQHLCRFPGWNGIALVSRHPFAGDPLCSEAFALAAAPIVIGGTRVWLVSAHLPWPWPYDNAENEAAAEELLAGLDAPAVVAGDLNSFPWTSRVRRIAAASNSRPAGPVRPTFRLGPIPFPIDMAFAPGGGSLERRPRFGSDHHGIVADLSLRP